MYLYYTPLMLLYYIYTYVIILYTTHYIGTCLSNEIDGVSELYTTHYIGTCLSNEIDGVSELRK